MNDPTSPYFENDFKNTEIAVLGTFDQISAKIHVDSFCNIYEFGEQFNIISAKIHVDSFCNIYEFGEQFNIISAKIHVDSFCNIYEFGEKFNVILVDGGYWGVTSGY